MHKKSMKLNLGAAAGFALGAVLLSASIVLHSQAADADKPANDLPNPYITISDWAKTPAGFVWGATGGVGVDPAGNVWDLQRCGGTTCAGATEDPILEFDKNGKFIKSFGAGIFVTPHGFFVDKKGNLWATDFAAKDGKGMQVFQFDQNGKILMTLGKAGVAGTGNDEFNEPSGVALNSKGEIFIADGHGTGPSSNYRVVKYSPDGKFVKTWGTQGSGPGQFQALHAIAVDKKDRVLVADKGNNRIQIFDSDGNYITEWKQFGRPASIAIDKDNNIYVADNDSNAKSHPGWQRGIRIGSANDGSVKYFIPDPNSDPNLMGSSAAEGVGVDAEGNVYGAEVTNKDLKKYVKK